MTPSRPYMLRAFYEWILDNHLTAHIVIDASLPGVDVPQQYVEDGHIVLNVSAQAVRDLSLANDHVAFQARFSGIPHNIYAPIRAVTAIYAKENGRGMVFKEEDFDEDPPPATSGGSEGGSTSGGSSGTGGRGTTKGRPNLTLVK